MKIKIEIDKNLIEDEVIIKSRSLTPEIEEIQRTLASLSEMKGTMSALKDDRQYYIDMDEILFFETDGDTIALHTATDMYHTTYKLYELEEMLPGHFMRISKSTIVNVRKIYSISRNLSSSSLIEFKNTHKQIYVSRHYYKPLKNKLEEMRGKR